MLETIFRGNYAVTISNHTVGASYFATTWVNVRNGMAHADICTSRWKGKTLQGARRWAERWLDNAAGKEAPCPKQ